MQLSKLIAAPFVVALFALPSQAPAQVGLTVRFGARLGPDIGVYAYSAERNGDWQNNYRKWAPVTLYDVNGRYYRNSVEGSRAVAVYSYNGEYFLPPTDQGWVNKDRRYNYDRRPNDTDRSRTRDYVAYARPDRRLGAEVGVLTYEEERAGPWQNNYRRWTPTTVYESSGHYYQNNAPGARAVQIYRYQNEYFLPPRDQAWLNKDKRYDYNHKPTDDDHSRGRGHP